MTAVLFTGLFSTAGAEVSLPGTLVVSATSNTRQQIDEAEERKKELEDGKKQNEGELSDLKGEQNGLKKELKSLNDQLTQIVANPLPAPSGHPVPPSRSEVWPPLPR